MNLLLRKVKINNFLSIESEEVDLADQGLVLVKGRNDFDTLLESNGSGKSTIFESILWCLTGKTSRGAKDVKNSYTKGDLSVELDFDIDEARYRVIRKSKEIEIYKGDDNISGNTLTKSKEVLNEILGYINYDLLVNIVLLSQGLPDKFSSLSPIERKSRLEYLSRLDVLIDNIKLRIEKVENELSQKREETQLELNKATGAVEVYKDSLETYKSMKSVKVSKEEYELNKNLIKELSDKNLKFKEELNKIKEEFSAINKRKLDKLYDSTCASSEVTTLQNQLDKYKKDQEVLVNNECPYCHQHVGDEELLNKNKEEIKNLEEVLKSQIDLKLKLESELNNLIEEEANKSKEYEEKVKESDVSSLMEQIQKANEIVAKYESISQSNEDIDKQIEHINSMIDELSKEIFEKKLKLNKIESEIDMTKFYKNSASRKLGNFLLSGVIDYLNKRLEFYSSYLFDNDKINLVSEESKIELCIGTTNFNQLSGGEGRRVDLCMQLALRDLAQLETGFTCNLLVVDEVLDYLDKEGIASVLRMLEFESSVVDSIMLVSHQSDLPVSEDKRILVCKCKDRISRII